MKCEKDSNCTPCPVAVELKGHMRAILFVMLLTVSCMISASAATTIRVVSTTVAPGASGTFIVELDADGTEDAITLSLNYDPNVIEVTSVRSENIFLDPPPTNPLNIADAASTGKFGTTLNPGQNRSFNAGAGQSILTVNFTATGASGSVADVVFASNQPTILSASDSSGAAITLNTVNGTVTIVDPRTDPNLTWTNPDPITYGTSLQNILNATRDSTGQNGTESGNAIQGDIVYTENSTVVTSSTVLAAGTHTLIATFTPTGDNSANVQTVTKNVTLTVNRKQLTVAPTVNGTPLTAAAPTISLKINSTAPTLALGYSGFIAGEGATIFDIVGNTAPTLSHPSITDINTVTSAVADHALSVLGGTAANYEIIPVNGTLSIVLKTLPVITWLDPSDITYGTLLSATQLNAQADISGDSFVYDPPLGAALDAGSAQTLSVTFTPTDQTEFAIVTDTAAINVNKAVLAVTVPSVTKQFGAPVPSPVVALSAGDVSGLVNNDTLTGVGLNTATTATQTSEPGTYPITAVTTSQNYTIGGTEGTLTISPKTLQISSVSDQTVEEGREVVVGITVSDGDVVALSELTVTGTSSNTSVVPDSNIIEAGAGAGRVVNVKTVPGQTGNTTITLKLDNGNHFVTTSFLVTVNPRNVPPVLANIETSPVAYTENDTATPITSSVTISDSDSSNLVGAMVRLLQPHDPREDVLGFASVSGISGTFDPQSGTLRLVGSSSVANYEAALRSVTYFNSSDDPAVFSRSIGFAVEDGPGPEGLSNELVRQIAVTAVNDLPEISPIPAQTVIKDSPGAEQLIVVRDPEADRGGVVFDNSKHPLGKTFTAENGVEFGDQIYLSGNDRTIRDFEFQAFLSDNASGNETIELFLRKNDGAANNSPATLLHSSGSLLLQPGFQIISVPDLLLNDLPPSITWTVIMNGIDPGEQAGLELFGPPAVGASLDDFWVKDPVDGTWSNFLLEGGAVPANFSARAVGVVPLTLTGVSSNPDVVADQNITFSGDGNNRTVKVAPNAGVTDTTASITVTVDDGDGGTDSETFLVTIIDRNRVPTIGAITDQNIFEDPGVQTVVLGGIAPGPSDESGQLLTLTAESNNPTVVPDPAIQHVAGSATASLIYTPNLHANGTALITVTVQDDGGIENEGVDTVIEMFTITVAPLNDAPTLTSITEQVIDEDAGTQTVSLAGISPGPADESGQTLTFTATSSEPAIVPNPTITPDATGGTGTLTYAPAANANGSVTITVTVQDDGGVANGGVDSLETTFPILVNPANDAPNIAAISDRTVNEDSLLSVNISATDPETGSTGITYGLASGSPAGMGIDSTTGVLTWTPTEAQGPGTFTITVEATDDASPPLTGSANFLLTVFELNVSPVVSSISSQTVAEGNNLSFSVSASDDDIPSNSLNFSLSVAPPGASITSGGSFSWTPGEGDGPGSYSIVVSVSDGTSNAAGSFSVNVTEENSPPSIAPISDLSVDEGNSVNVTASASDPDLPNQTLSFSLDAGSAAGASISSSGAFSWTPTEAQGPGTFGVTVRVTDNGPGNLSATESFSITVNELNLPPLMPGLSDRGVPEGETLTFFAAGVDGDEPANNLTFSLPNAPSGATIDPGSGAFSWTPTEAQGPSENQVTVQVTDDGPGNLSASQSLTINVFEINAAPELAPLSNQAIGTGETLSVTANGSDPDLPVNTLTYSLLNGPAGATIDASSGVFTWSPDPTTADTTVGVSIQVADDGSPSLSATQSFTVEVTSSNAAPLITAIPDQTVDEGTPLGVSISATDADLPVQAVTFSLLPGAPTGASIGATSGQFTWTPTEADGPGSVSITVQAEDNGTPPLSSTQSFSVLVNEVNEAPVLDPIADQTVLEEELLSVSAAASDTDLPPNNLSFSLVGGAPDGAGIDPATGLITWTPAIGQGPSSNLIVVQVSDGGTPNLSAIQTFTVVVEPSNRAPQIIAIGDQSVDEETPFSVTAAATDEDQPAQTLTYSLRTAPSGMEIDPASGLITWAPTEEQGPSDNPVTVEVSDNGTPPASGTQSFNVVVNEVNQNPVLAALLDRTVISGNTLTASAQATDADIPANNLTYSLDTAAPAGATIDPASGLLEWTPSPDQADASHGFTVIARDDATPTAGEASQSFTVTVASSNTAPELGAIGAQTVDEGELLALTITGTDTDVPVQPLVYELVSGPPGAQIDPLTGELSWTPTEEEGPATVDITVQVTDSVTPPLSATSTFTVTVNEVNTAPVVENVSSESVTVNEEETVSVTVTASDSDFPANVLTYSLDANAPQGASIDPASGVFSWTPTKAQGPSNNTINVVVTDNGTPGLSANASFTVVVNEINSPPTLAAIGDQTVLEGEPLTFTASGIDTDIPAQDLRFSLALGAPARASIDPVTGVFAWTPDEAQGPFAGTISVRVTDNGTPIGRASQAVNVVVEEANIAPVLGALSDQIVSVGDTLTVEASATDADLPANALTFSLTADAPAGAAIDATTGVFTWTPTIDQVSPGTTITVVVTDNGPGTLSHEQSFNVEVKEGVNLPPALSTITAQTVPENGSTPGIAFTLTDPDTPLENFKFTVSSSNLDLVPKGNIVIGGAGENRTVQVRPVKNKSGSATITLAVSEPAGGKASTSFDMTVAPLPPAFVKNLSPEVTVQVGGTVDLSVTVSGSKPIAYVWTKDGVELPGETGAVLALGEVTVEAAGSYSVSASNSVASINSNSTQVNVIVPLRIVDQPVGQKVLVGADVSFGVLAVGELPLTYQWRVDGVEIPDPTGATLSLGAVEAILAGSYSVVVSDASGGSVTSTAAALEVIAGIVITVQPESQVALAGESASLSVTATGTEPIAYQWQYNGIDIGGETQASLSLSNLVPENSGDYAVVVSNVGGSVTSSAATLAVSIPPAITQQPQGKEVLAGTPVTFEVTVSGTEPLTYQWQFNGTPIAGATGRSLSLPDVTVDAAGDYGVTATNAAGSVPSDAATLVVVQPVVITAQPQDQTVAAGAGASFSVTATGTDPLSFQWQFRGVNIDGATDATLSLSNVQATDAGAYQAVVSNVAGPVPSAAATLTVNVGVVILEQPQSVTVTSGDSASFAVLASGTPAPTYQWRVDGNDIAGATGPSLSVANATPANAGAYSVVVQNIVGPVTSSDAVLAVITPPSIETQPQSQTVDLGASVTFSVTALGDAPLSFQWQKNGGNIAGATGQSFTIASAQASDSGSYGVVVENPGGATPSDSATLTVNLPPIESGNSAATAPPPVETASGSFDGGSNLSGGGQIARRNAPPAVGEERWFAWRAPSAGIVTFDTAGSTFDTVLTIYTGTPDNLTLIATDDDRGGFLASEVRFNAIVGTTYLVNVKGFGNAGGQIVVSFNLNATSQQLPVLTTSPQSVTATVGDSVSFLVVAEGTDLAYQWLRNGVEIAGETNPTLQLANVQESDALSYVVRVTSTTVVANPVSVESLPALLHVGTVDSLSEDKFLNSPRLTGGVQLQNVGGSLVIQPPSTRAGGSVARGFSGSQVFSTFGASKEPGEPNHCDVVGGASQWFTYAAPETGVVRVSTEGSDFDTVLAVYSGSGTSFADLVMIACDNNSGADGTTSAANVQVTAGEQYFVAVDGVGGASGTVKLSYEFATGPGIATQPAAASVNVGEQVVLFVVTSAPVAGASAIAETFQWKKDGFPIPDQTANNLTFPAVSLADAGEYTVVVSNFAGSTTSDAVRLDVSVPLAVTTQPANQSATVGDPLSFSVVASGSAPISYQWQLDGTDLAGATAATYRIASAQTGDEGSYTVVVSNPVGTVTSNPATLSLSAAPTVNEPPADIAVVVGQQVDLAVDASGTGTLAHQWRFNGVDILGATEPSFALFNVGPENVGAYTVVVSNEAGSVISAPAQVSVQVPFAIVEEPQNQALAAGSTALFNVRVSGSGPFTYQWRVNDADLPGATEPTMAVANVQIANEGSYTVVVGSDAEQLVSRVAILSVSSLPVISVQPQGGVFFAGQDVTFSVTAAGSGVLEYQWLLDGEPLAGATTADLALSNVGLQAAGTYSVIVSNNTGSAGSELAILTVRDIVSQVTKAAGTDAPPSEFSFRVSVPAGNQARVQVSTDMANWSDLTPAPVTGIVDITDPDSVSLALRFYRVIVEAAQ